MRGVIGQVALLSWMWRDYEAAAWLYCAYLCTKRFNGRDDLHGILRGDSADLKGDVLSVSGWRNSGKGLLWAVSVIQCVLKGCPEGDKNDE